MDKYKIKSLLNNIENPIIFEIGANDGEDSLQFCNTFQCPTLYCFEPDNRAYDKLSKALSSFVLENKVIIYKKAIGNVDGETTFYVSDSNPEVFPTPQTVGKNWDKSGSIKKPLNHKIIHPWCKFDKTNIVEINKLDTVTKELNITHIDFIWADVQGAESDLILGGLDTLNNKTKFLYTEFDNDNCYEGDASKNKILSLLPNFQLIEEVDNNLLLKNKTMVNNV